MSHFRRLLVLILVTILVAQCPLVVAEDDPFAVFDELFRNQQIAQGDLRFDGYNADYAFLIEPLLELFWPTENLPIEPTSRLQKPSGDFISSALSAGNTVNTSIAFLPGDFLTSLSQDWADVIKNSRLKLSKASVSGMDLGALEWQQWGIPVFTLKGMRDKNALYVGSNFIGQDVLAITRQQLESLIYMGVQAGEKELARSGYSDIAWFLMKSMRQRNSGMIQAVEQCVSACSEEIIRWVDAARSKLQPVNGAIYPYASSVVTVDFSSQEIANLLEKRELWPVSMLLSSGWKLISTFYSYEENMEVLKSIGYSRQAKTANDIREMDFKGQLRFFLNDQEETVAMEVKADFGIEVYTITLAMEEGEDGALYTAKFKMESTGVYSAGSITWDFALDRRYPYSSTCSVRINTVGGSDRQVGLDAGLQYKSEWMGDKENGTENERLNVYYQDIDNSMEKFSLISSAAILPSGIKRQVSLYYDDLNSPLASIILQTEEASGTALWDDMQDVYASKAIYPVQWDLEQWSTYAESHADNITGKLMQLVSLLPSSIRFDLGI